MVPVQGKVILSRVRAREKNRPERRARQAKEPRQNHFFGPLGDTLWLVVNPITDHSERVPVSTGWATEFEHRLVQGPAEQTVQEVKWMF